MKKRPKEEVMKIWVDADACPKVIKEILYRASQRTQTQLTLVANSPMNIPGSQYIDFIVVSKGFDVADGRIVQEMQKGDLVITADVPLAFEVIEKGGVALNPHGVFFTKDNIGERLSVRNFLSDLRDSGVTTGGPPAFSIKDRNNFANKLDTFLAKHKQP